MLQPYVLLVHDNKEYQLYLSDFSKNSLVVFAKDTIPHVFKEGMTLTAILFDDIRGKIYYQGTIDKIVSMNIILTDMKNIQNEQRREEARVPYEVNIEVKYFKKSDSDQLIKLQKGILFTTKNISANGLLLVSDLDIPENVGFLIEFPFQHEKVNKLKFWAEIKRKWEHTEKFHYGCQIVWENNNDQNLFRNFILRQQVLIYNKKNK